MTYQLKPIARESVPRALEKAERYRLLNEPFQAESICLDVLAVEPDHQAALVCLVLALSDQLGAGGHQLMGRIKAAIARLAGEYDRLYYAGLMYERRGQAAAESNAVGSRDVAWEYITEAMALYERAHAHRPPGNDDATLRWNTCVRLIQSHHLVEPSRDHHEAPLE